MAFPVEYMEIMVTNSCNLHCDGCGNYSNLGLKEQIDATDYAEIIRLWSKRVSPATFRILGGEPMVHPELPKIIEAAAKAWPDNERILVTNGLLAHKHPEIPELLRRTKTGLHVSFHSNDPKYLEKMKPALKLLKKWADDGVWVTWSDQREFLRRYRGLGKTMLPYADGNPAASYAGCPAKKCISIAKGRLWKCPTIAQLSNALKKFDLLESPDWQPYLRYEGIGLDASDQQLESFLARKVEKICDMCPAVMKPYQKDVFNVNFQRNEEYIEVNFPPVNIPEIVASL